MTRAFVALGSNRDDPPARLDAACRALSALPGHRLVAESPRYWTDPVGDENQPRFLNAVVALDSEADDPHALLAELQRIEDEQGRVRDPARRWGPRALDLDLLLFGDRVLEDPDLVLPHPRMHQRAFVLRPLADLAPDAEVPGRGTVRDLLARVDCSGVRPADSRTRDPS